MHAAVYVNSVLFDPYFSLKPMMALGSFLVANWLQEVPLNIFLHAHVLDVVSHNIISHKHKMHVVSILCLCGITLWSSSKLNVQHQSKKLMHLNLIPLALAMDKLLTHIF